MKGIFWIEIGLVQLILVGGCMDHLLSSCYFVMAVQCTYFIISKEDHREIASQPVLYLASIAFLPCSEKIQKTQMDIAQKAISIYGLKYPEVFLKKEEARVLLQNNYPMVCV